MHITAWITILMNTDANAAMIKFLKGLNGNNEGLSVLGERLKDLEVGGARGVQALAALSANSELLEKRQKTANEALQEGTSLTNEYEIKNKLRVRTDFFPTLCWEKISFLFLNRIA